MSRVYVGSYVILGSTEDAFYGYGYNSLDKYDRYIYRSLYKAMSNMKRSLTYRLPMFHIRGCTEYSCA